MIILILNIVYLVVVGGLGGLLLGVVIMVVGVFVVGCLKLACGGL